MDIEVEIFRKKSIIKNVPETTWEELKPYWPSIAKSIIEVFVKGKFKPYSVRKDKKDGFYAAEWYWEQSEKNNKNYPLKESKKFIKMLLEKKDFVKSIKVFNKAKNVDWTLKSNIKQLRHFLYANFYSLEKFLNRF